MRREAIMLSRIIGLSAMALALQGCVYGVVNDANTGSAISAANVRVISGSCSGAGCGAAPVTEVTTDAGLYVFDAYGDRNGAANVKLISPASGQEAIRLSVQKPGYVSRTVYHRPKYQEVMNEGKNYLISAVTAVYLCPLGSIDSDADTICDAAEARYQTNPNSSDTDGDNLSDAAELFGAEGVDLAYFGADP